MAVPVKRLVLLGSTGSIGRQTLDIVRALPGRFRVVGLAAGRNLDLLAEQVREFDPVCISFQSDNVREDTARLFPGREFISPVEMAARPDADIVVMAVSGSAGLEAVMAAVKAGKTIALANKESLVSAGELITAGMKRTGARILPVDSEHSAIWQCLAGEKQPPRRIILTASGGPFRGYTREKMTGITVEDALAHPSWSMGKKVTIDSATLMNKGLEVIEARWLFDVPIEDIRVLVHPRSIVHSMVEFSDGSVKAQLGCPDMRLPIQYALTWPDRVENPGLPKLDWDGFSGLAFEPPDVERFPCLGLGIEAGRRGGTYPAALCAADEVAVGLFMARKIGFTDIADIIKKVMERHRDVPHPDIEAILAADARARQMALDISGGVKG